MAPRKNVRTICFFVCVLCALSFNCWMAAQIPYTHDDWNWGIAAGLRHLLSADINSRYAGNLLVILLTRSPVLKTLVMGSVFTAIPLLGASLAPVCAGADAGEVRSETLRIVLFLTGFLFFLLCRDALWAQTSGWVSGFSNFVMSGLLLLLFYRIVYAGMSGGAAVRASAVAVCFFFGVLIQLFLENLSLYFLGFSLASVLLCAVRRQRSAPLAAVFAGTVAGAVLMFSSGIYRSLWQTGAAVDQYRQIVLPRGAGLPAMISSAAGRLWGEFLPQLPIWSGLFPAAVCLLLAVFLIRERSLPAKRGAAELLLCAANVILALCFLCVYVFFRHREADEIADLPGRRPLLALALLYLILISFELVRLFRTQRRTFVWILVFWFSPYLILAPLLIVNTVGPRSFYTGQLCDLMLVLTLIALLWKNSPDRLRTAAAVCCMLCALLLSLYWGRIYAAIGGVKRERDAALAGARDGQAACISLPAYPYRQYLWIPDPVNGEFLRDFRAFYGVPEGVELLFE